MRRILINVATAVLGDLVLRVKPADFLERVDGQQHVPDMGIYKVACVSSFECCEYILLIDRLQQNQIAHAILTQTTQTKQPTAAECTQHQNVLSEKQQANATGGRDERQSHETLASE